MVNKEEFRKILLDLKQQLEEKLDKTQEHIRHAGGPVSKSFDEQASERSNDEVVFNLDNQARAELIEIESALSKIENDEYGRCEQCGDEIEAERLKAIPFTSICKTCAYHSS